MSLDHALYFARENTIVGKPKMAALIYDRSSLISVGLNSYKTHPLQAKFSKHPSAICLHAEIAAIVNAKQDVEGMTMYIARVFKNGSAGLAMPCEGCRRALIQFKLGDVRWTK